MLTLTYDRPALIPLSEGRRGSVCFVTHPSNGNDNGDLRMRAPVVTLLMIFLFIMLGCEKDSNPAFDPYVAPPLSEDYFPVTTNYLWTYSTNALSDSGKVRDSIDIKIGAYAFPEGTFQTLLGRFVGTTAWGPVLSLLDSGNTVYTLGDHPPETPYPLFKHVYANDEVQPDSVEVLGARLPAVKLTKEFNPGRPTSFWFVKGIGLVKQSSQFGQSIFTDDNSSKNVLIETTLIGFEK